MPVLLVVISLLAFLLSFFGTAAMRRLALRNGWIAAPRADRWHRRVTALHGGVGFYPPFLLISIAVLIGWEKGAWFSGAARDGPFGYATVESGLLAGSFVMFLVGLADDVKHLRPTCKFVGQAAAAGLLLLSGGGFSFMGGGGSVIDSALTFLWITGITNATNMLDNMDGLTAGTAAIEALTLVALGFSQDMRAATGPLSPSVPLGLILAAVLAGFRVHNRHPASIFMGDSGSLSTGFILAALSIPGSLQGLSPFTGIQAPAAAMETGAAATAMPAMGPVPDLMVPVMVMAVPLFDTTLVTLTRLWRSRSPFQGGVDHASHRMVKLGMSEKNAVLCLHVLAALGGIIAILLHMHYKGSLFLAGLFALSLILFGIHLARVEVR